MKLLFYLHHPAQFHLFKYVIEDLRKQHQVIILATKKDVLEDLLKERGFEYINVLPQGRKDNKFSIAFSLLKQDIKLFKICRKFKPDILIGTSTEITHIGKLLSIPSLFFIEDDIKVIPLVGMLAHPYAKHIVAPSICDTGKWKNKTIKYPGYQKLAYLHPNYFKPDLNIIKKYLSVETPFFIIRLAKLKAHHDSGIIGISQQVLEKIIANLESRGRVIIFSEAVLPVNFKQYQIKINPNEIHHFLYYADLFIGDSQSMAVESSILGTPNIRVSSFSGRISVLEELEHEYGLTFGIKPDNELKLFEKINEFLNTKHVKDVFQERRKKMLSDKIDVTQFLIYLINQYPQSVESINQGKYF